MKYVFFGTPRFAEIILGRLIHADMAPVALVCNPDRPVGRKKIITPPRTKMLVEKSGEKIAILQPEKLDDAFIAHVTSLKPDFFVVAAYAKIIPNVVLAIPPLGTLGTHPSLLPKYRGASPIQSVILNGDTETGTTIYLMDEKMDRGAIIAQEKYTIGSESISYEDLEEALAELSAKLLIKTIPALMDSNTKPAPQNESEATFTKKFMTEDGYIDEKELASAEKGDLKTAETIVRKINAFTPEPGAWTRKNGTRVKLLKAIIQNGSLKLSKTQEEGGKPRTL